MVTITLSEPQLDKIVVYDLKKSLEQQYELDTDESGEYIEPDYDLIEALKTVLQYYMPYNEVTEFMEEIHQKVVDMYSTIKQE